MSAEHQSRRRFLVALPATAVAVALSLSPRSAWAIVVRPHARPKHPDPRPGITGKNVLTHAQLEDNPDVIPLFDHIRQIPQIVDGIRCHCGCADTPGYRSLLSCYEGDGMAQDCTVCQGQGKLAWSLSRQGKTLDQIRAAIDTQFD